MSRPAPEPILCPRCAHTALPWDTWTKKRGERVRPWRCTVAGCECPCFVEVDEPLTAADESAIAEARAEIAEGTGEREG